MSDPDHNASASGVPDSPEAIKEQIEETRAELAETVEALAYKADVKARAKEKAAEVSRKAKGAASGGTQAAREKATSIAHTAADAAGQVAERAKQVAPLKGSSQPDGAAGTAQPVEVSSTASSNGVYQAEASSTSRLDRRTGAVAAGGLAGLLVLVTFLIRRRRTS